MRPKRWWSVILTMGLFMGLSSLNVQAGPNRAVVPQVNRQACTRPQPRACAPQPNRQAFTPPQPRAFANGGNSQPHQWQQPRGNAYGWNGQNRQWQQPRGNAYGWNRQPNQWQQPRGNAYGWNGHQRQGDQHRNAYGWNDHQQGQQPRPAIAQEDRPGNRQFQPANGGQQYNPGSSYNRTGYPVQPQSPNIAPSSSGYSRNTTIPASQTGAQPGFRSRSPEASGNVPQSQGKSPSGVI